MGKGPILYLNSREIRFPARRTCDRKAMNSKNKERPLPTDISLMNSRFALIRPAYLLARLSVKCSVRRGVTIPVEVKHVDSDGSGIFSPLSVILQIPSDYPSKPVRVIEPFGAGGGPDLIARAVSPKLSELWGQPATVDNHPGAGSTAAPALVAKSSP